MITNSSQITLYDALDPDFSDSRINGYFLMTTIFQPLSVAFLYLIFVLHWGPNYMQDRRPFKLNKVIAYYNLFQILSNGYIAYHGLLELLKINWICAEVDYAETPHNLFIAKLSYCYFLLKILDLADTVFFVLKKNTRQVSFLHVYHHVGMIFLTWAGARVLAGGHSIFLGAINSFVHVIMYSYYFLTIWKSEYKRSMWWKKHITQLQIIQFVFFTVTYTGTLFQSTCYYPKWAVLAFLPNNTLVLSLFCHFYWQNYIKSVKASKED